MKLNYKDIAGFTKNEIKEISSGLEDYREHLETVSKQATYDEPESSLHLPFDDSISKEVQAKLKEKKSSTLQYVVVIGIGGSNLGTMALYQTVAGSFNLLVDRLPKLLFLDTLSNEKIVSVVSKLKHLASKEDFLIVSISKSGGTTETIVNTEALKDELTPWFGDVSKRIVVVTSQKSNFWKAAERKNIARVSIPEKVLGRYSVFSSVGLLPLELAKINTSELLKGARRAIKDGVSKNLEKNRSLVSAALTYLHYKNGISIHNSFIFKSRMETIGKWYCQLLGESLGKKNDLDGNVVNAGITPIVSIGTNDLHSMAQLFYGGPRDKFTNIIYANRDPVFTIPKMLTFPNLVDNIQGKTMCQIMHAIIDGVQKSYKKEGLPFLTIELRNVREKELGYFLQFRMIEIMYLAKLMNVNAFDQPAVEAYKKETRKLLSK